MKKTNIIIKKLQKSWAKIISSLKNIWLSQNEISIYLTSLSIWPSTASILWQKNWINRSTAQYTCQTLVNKKIMSISKKNNYYIFWAESPRRIINILKKEEEKIIKIKEEFLEIIWDLKSINPSLKQFKCCNKIHNLLEKCDPIKISE